VSSNPTGSVGNVGTTGSNTPASGTPTVGLQMAPYSQVAPLTNQQQQYMGDISALTGPAQGYATGMMNTGNQLIGGTMPGALNTQNQMLGAAGSAMPMQNWLASGAAMSPTSNPYLQGMYNVGTQDIMQQYQQATAPNILQQAASSGTLGSAGEAQNFQNAQAGLGQALGNYATGLFGNAYNTGLNATQNAVNQGLNLGQNAVSTGLNTALGAMNQAPNLMNALYTPAQQLQTAGNMGQQYAQNVLNTANQNLTGQANWPMQALSALGQGLSTASGGGNQSVSIGAAPSTSAGK
jgi:hypothetical protein